MLYRNGTGRMFLLLAVLIVFLVAVFPTGTAVAQSDFPTKNVTMIVPHAGGGDMNGIVSR